MDAENLKHLAASVIELDGRATPGAWTWEDGYEFSGHRVGPTLYSGRTNAWHGLNNWDGHNNERKYERLVALSLLAPRESGEGETSGA